MCSLICCCVFVAPLQKVAEEAPQVEKVDLLASEKASISTVEALAASQSKAEALKAQKADLEVCLAEQAAGMKALELLALGAAGAAELVRQAACGPALQPMPRHMRRLHPARTFFCPRPHLLSTR